MTTIKQQIQAEARELLRFESSARIDRAYMPERRGTILTVTVQFFVPNEAKDAGWKDIPLHDVVSTACDDLYMRLLQILRQQLPEALRRD